jgi:hypothetical protein
MDFVIKSAIFWDVMPRNPLKDNRCFRGIYHFTLHAFTLVSCSAYSTLNMEAIDMFLRNVDWLSRTKWHYVPEDSTLHNHCCENHKSCNFIVIFCLNTFELVESVLWLHQTHWESCAIIPHNYYKSYLFFKSMNTRCISLVTPAFSTVSDECRKSYQ